MSSRGVKALLEGIGKVPVVCAATPGFIVPRIQALAMNEAARMVEEGVASAEDIDKAIRYGFGFRYAVLGLLEFIDWGGGDILYYASRYLEGALHSDRYRAPEVIANNMRDGRIGMRTGAGFLDYSGLDVDAYREKRLAEMVELLRHFGLARPPVLDNSVIARSEATKQSSLPRKERKLDCFAALAMTLSGLSRPRGRALPEHVLQHAFLHHGDAVEFDRGAHHRQIEMP